jgi:hypothetical protein
MPVNSVITDNFSSLSADVIHNDKCDCSALSVATTPYRTFENSIQFFLNSTYGASMNVDASVGGTPEKVHDGGDSVLWTGSDVVNTNVADFNNSDFDHTTGAGNSVKINNPDVGSVFQFLNASPLTLSNYVSLTMWIYVDKDWRNGDDIELYAYDTSAGVVVGNAVGLQDYFDYSQYDTWQKLVIPLTDLDISTSTTVDALRFRIVAAERKSPRWYLDDIQFEATGAPVSFDLTAGLGTWLHVDEMTISVADAYVGTLADATMPNLAYDKILNTTLSAGITYRRVIDGKTSFSFNVKGLLDFLQLPGSELVNCGSDGTNSWMVVRIRNIEPIVLKAENDDTLSYIVSEDLSGLLRLRITAGCRIEQRGL